MKADIVNASITSIDCNPFRDTGKYPFVKSKIDALKRSIEAVGMWEGVIVRKKGNRYELAFGHHRVESARQLGLTKIPVIVRDLTEEQMLQFMGRENGEDFNTEFLTLLETWEAGINFRSADRKSDKPIEVASLLGWTVMDRGSETLTMTAKACNAAHALIKGGHIARADLAGLSVKSAREITERAYARIKQLEEMAKTNKYTPKETERAKSHIAAGAKAAAASSRQGIVAQKDLRKEVDRVANQRAGASKDKTNPLLSLYAKELADQIHKMLAEDSAASKLEEVVKAIPHITLEEDERGLRKIDFALAELEDKTASWRKKLSRKGGKVVPFVQLVNGGK